MARFKFDEIVINSTEKKKPVEEDKYTYLGLEHLDSGTLRVSRFGADVAPIGEKLIMRKGDVLFGKRRAYQKKVAIAPFDGIFSAHGMVLRPRTNVISPKLFPFFVSSNHFLDEAIKISVGSLSPTINWRDLKDLEFNIPPIEKQDVLADQLWAMEEMKEAYNQLLIATDALVKSQFIEMFGDPKTNPEGWEIKKLGEFCKIRSGTSIPIEIENEGGPIAYIKVADMNLSENEKYITTSSRYVLEATANNGIYEVGTIIFPKNGAAIATNKKRLTKVAVCIDLNTMGVTPFIDVNREYLYSWFQLLDLSEISNTSALPSINAKTISELSVILPPINKQNEYADFVLQLDKSKFALLQNIEKLEQCRSALMQKSFG